MSGYAPLYHQPNEMAYSHYDQYNVEKYLHGDIALLLIATTESFTCRHFRS